MSNKHVFFSYMEKLAVKLWCMYKVIHVEKVYDMITFNDCDSQVLAVKIKAVHAFHL